MHTCCACVLQMLTTINAFSISLQRQSFGMFKPTKIVCAVDDIFNIVEPVEEEAEEDQKDGDAPAPAWKQTYIFDVFMDIETPNSILPVRLVNYGTCSPVSPVRLGVKFTEGTLQPRFDMSAKENATLAAAWKETFEQAITKESEAQSYLGQLGTWAMHKLMKVLMGLEPPVDQEDFTQTYHIRKPPSGHLDLLYLDGDLRISRGNKGTIVAVERVKDEKK